MHNGRVVKRTGDGALVEFRSVVDAVRCAIEVQNAMVERNAGLAPERRIVFRIGIHLGDVVEESDGDLMGDGINIAARLEGIAEPGAICLSEDAYRQVKGRLDLAVTDLGATRLKNIAEPIRAYSLQVGVPAQAKAAPAVQRAEPPAQGRALSRWGVMAAVLVALVLAAGAFAWRAGYAPNFMAASVDDKLANAPSLSFVVLPFENLSDDKEQDYFADAITDDLTTALSHILGSFVIARDTAFTYKGKAVDAKRIGRELGVRYLLEGSVRRVGDKIAVNAQLISTETGAHVWAERFDGERSRLGELQVEFVTRLAETLRVELAKAESLRSLRERPTNPDATDLALRGWAAYYLPDTPEHYAKAIEYFEQALRIDPQQEEALIGLSMQLAESVLISFSADPARDAERSAALASLAVLAHPESAWAHYAKSESLYANKQIDAAIAEAEAAIALDPNFSRALHHAGYYKIYLGRAAEGFSGVEKALRINPHYVSIWYWQYSMCNLHEHLAQWDQAIEWCRKSVASQAIYVNYALLAAGYSWAGRDAEARATVAELLKLKPGYTVEQWLKYAKHYSDNQTYQRELQPIAEGLKKAGLPEQ